MITHATIRQRQLHAKVVAAGVKTCPICTRTLPLSEFNLRDDKKGCGLRYGAYCKVCAKLCVRELNLRRDYNLTNGDVDAITKFQNNVCAICGRVPINRSLSIDHNHVTGLIRGALCWYCNKALGYLNDSLDAGLRLCKYLQHPPATSALKKETFGILGSTKAKNRGKHRSKYKEVSTYLRDYVKTEDGLRRLEAGRNRAENKNHQGA